MGNEIGDDGLAKFNEELNINKDLEKRNAKIKNFNEQCLKFIVNLFFMEIYVETNFYFDLDVF